MAREWAHSAVAVVTVGLRPTVRHFGRYLCLRRMGNTPLTELKVAAQQQMLITEQRLRDVASSRGLVPDEAAPDVATGAWSPCPYSLEQGYRGIFRGVHPINNMLHQTLVGLHNMVACRWRWAPSDHLPCARHGDWKTRGRPACDCAPTRTLDPVCNSSDPAIACFIITICWAGLFSWPSRVHARSPHSPPGCHSTVRAFVAEHCRSKSSGLMQPMLTHACFPAAPTMRSGS
jgi:hypothetical protein